MVTVIVNKAKTFREYLRESPYFQPNSPIWWMGLISVLAGVVKALAVTHEELADAVVIIDTFSATNMSPGMLVSIGLSIMGLKAQLEKK